MKVITLYLAQLLCFSAAAFAQAADFSPAAWVNPFIGASANKAAAGMYHGLGKTFPGATTPYGMVQVSPNTITGGDNAPGYSYEHKTIEGFAFTQMSGTGASGDLGNFLVMPTTGPLKKAAGREDGSIGGYRARYDKTSERAEAGYYSVMLDDYGIRIESSATPRCGILRFTYPQSARSRIQIDLSRRVGGASTRQYIKVVDDHTVEGWMECTPESGGWRNGAGNADYTVYFHARFSKPLENYGFWSADIPDGWSRKRDDVTSVPYLEKVASAPLTTGVTEMKGKHLGFFTEFATRAGEEVTVKAGISFVDIAGARANFDAEIAVKDFDTVRREAFEMWNRELGRMYVEGGTDDEKTVFYTALYHTMIDPRIFTDVDGRYPGGDKTIRTSDGTFTKRTIFSGWDVFRSQFPLQTIINPRLVSDQLNSLITLADESGRGYFERWEIVNAYSGCMLGNPALSVLADAWVKGIRTFDVEKAYRYAVNTSALFGNDELGYTASRTGISHTLEYAYTDWCVAQLAAALGKSGDAAAFAKKAEAWRNTFDPEKGWFRPRRADGTWEPWPEGARTLQKYGCVESNPYQQGWFVPHDVEGMVSVMGGREAVLADLGAFFDKTPADMLWNDYYNHANEPVHLVPFLFNRLDTPWDTQKWTRHICRRAYRNAVEGLVGNEDEGQMSAWYVLAASGIHPSCPGSTRMEITSPVFDSVVFKLDAAYAPGGAFTVVAHDNSPQNVYIQRALLDGKPLGRCWLDFSEIASGSTLELFMGPEPNREWGVAPKQAGVGDAYPEWRAGYLDIHHINTGRGECMFAILPDGTTLMMDAGETGTDARNFKPDGSRGAGEWIARYMTRMMRPLPEKRLDYMLLSHFHDDHMGSVRLGTKKSDRGDYILSGITEVGDLVPFGKIVDRAWPDYDYPYPMADKPSMQNYIRFVRRHVADGAAVERFRVGSREQFSLLKDPDTYPGFEIRNIAANGVVWTGVHDNTRSHFPSLEHLAREEYPEENICSAGIRISYGNFDYFNGADPVDDYLAAGTWREIEPAIGRAVGPVEVCVANHHAKDAMGAGFVRAVRPRVFVIQGFALSHPDTRALRNMLSRELYPGERDIFTYNMFGVTRTVLGERLAGQIKSTRGHIVVRVHPGGDRYEVYILDDTSENFRITAVHGPYKSN